jgi:hypothetical protein
MSTSAAKPPRRMRLASGAKLIPTSRFQAWYDQALLTPRLNDVERGVLSAIAASYR